MKPERHFCRVKIEIEIEREREREREREVLPLALRDFSI
jgi:hypothetical protein